jgi:transposase-like protein
METPKRRGRPRLIDNDKADAVVAAYQSGEKLAKIERDFDVARATIYWLLERRGITDERVKRNVRLQVDSVTAAHLYDLISSQEEEIERLEAEVEDLRKQIADLG